MNLRVKLTRIKRKYFSKLQIILFEGIHLFNKGLRMVHTFLKDEYECFWSGIDIFAVRRSSGASLLAEVGGEMAAFDGKRPTPEKHNN